MKYHYLNGPVAIPEVYKHLLPICKPFNYKDLDTV